MRAGSDGEYRLINNDTARETTALASQRFTQRTPGHNLTSGPDKQWMLGDLILNQIYGRSGQNFLASCPILGGVDM